jgi:hypothetical protein
MLCGFTHGKGETFSCLWFCAASYSVRTGIPSPGGKSGQGVKLTSHLHLAQRITMCGAVLQLWDFTAWARTFLPLSSVCIMSPIIYTSYAIEFRLHLRPRCSCTCVLHIVRRSSFHPFFFLFAIPRLLEVYWLEVRIHYLFLRVSL